MMLQQLEEETLNLAIVTMKLSCLLQEATHRQDNAYGTVSSVVKLGQPAELQALAAGRLKVELAFRCEGGAAAAGAVTESLRSKSTCTPVDLTCTHHIHLCQPTRRGY